MQKNFYTQAIWDFLYFVFEPLHYVNIGCNLCIYIVRWPRKMFFGLRTINFFTHILIMIIAIIFFGIRRKGSETTSFFLIIFKKSYATPYLYNVKCILDILLLLYSLFFKLNTQWIRFHESYNDLKEFT